MKTIGENEAAQTAKGKATCRSKANYCYYCWFCLVLSEVRAIPSVFENVWGNIILGRLVFVDAILNAKSSASRNYR